MGGVGMTEAQCPVCGAAQSQSLLCSSCCDRLERDLGDVASIVDELATSMSKQAKIGAGSGTAGLARERMPISLGAMEAADNLGNVLTTWARDTTGPDAILMRAADSPSVVAARLLLMHIDAIRRHPAVNELLDEVTDAIVQARRAVDRPADRVYLGQCLMETPDEEGRAVTCLNELYARPNAHEVRCQVCLHEHPVAERRVWLLQRASDMLFTVKEAALLIGEVGGIKVTESSIRGYLHRGARLQYRAPVEAKRFRLGDLLAVVLDESERKSA